MGVRRTGPALIALMFSLMLVGCLSTAPAEWGTGPGMVSTEISDDVTTVTIHERVSTDSTNDIVSIEAPIIGCDSSGMVPQKAREITPEDYGGSPVSVQGWLASSANFPEHKAPAIQSIMIHLMDLSDLESETHIQRDPAKEVPNIQKWDDPLFPRVAFGSDMDGIEAFRSWAVVGVIPGNENVLEGMAGLSEWNRPILLEGYFLNGTVGSSQSSMPNDVSVSNCLVSDTTRFSAYMVVTTLEIDGVVASESETYSMGSIPIIGGPLYLMIVLIGGGAGAFGTFTYASIQIRTAASKQASMLMSEKQIQAAGGVVKELKKHKKEIENINQDSNKSESIGVVDDTSVKKVEIKEFDISATLEGPADATEALKSVSRTPGAGVIQTEAAMEMNDKLREVMESAMEEPSSPSSGPSGRRMSGGVTGGGGPGSRRTMSSSIISEETITESQIEDDPVIRRPPVKRKRAVRAPKEKVSEPEPEPEPKIETRDGPSISDDDEFSDFSF